MQKQQEFFKILYPGGHSLKNFEIYISEMGSSSLVWKKKKIPSIKREICTSKIPEYFFLDKAPTSKTCFALPFFFFFHHFLLYVIFENICWYWSVTFLRDAYSYQM